MSMKVSIPGDAEGFFGRTCPSCNGFFKLRVDEFKAAPENELVCAYCGHRASVSDFITADQRERGLIRGKGIRRCQDTERFRKRPPAYDSPWWHVFRLNRVQTGNSAETPLLC